MWEPNLPKLSTHKIYCKSCEGYVEIRISLYSARSNSSYIPILHSRLSHSTVKSNRLEYGNSLAPQPATPLTYHITTYLPKVQYLRHAKILEVEIWKIQYSLRYQWHFQNVTTCSKPCSGSCSAESTDDQNFTEA